MRCLWCGKHFEPTTSGQILCDKDRSRAAKIPRAVRIAAAKQATKPVDKP